jgi:hypothetical protein
VSSEHLVSIDGHRRPLPRRRSAACSGLAIHLRRVAENVEEPALRGLDEPGIKLHDGGTTGTRFGGKRLEQG